MRDSSIQLTGCPLEVADSIDRSSSSQEERISILKHALVQKGVISPSHYDLNPTLSTQPVPTVINPEQNPPSTTESGDDGLYL